MLVQFHFIFLVKLSLCFIAEFPKLHKFCFILDEILTLSIAFYYLVLLVQKNGSNKIRENRATSRSFQYFCIDSSYFYSFKVDAISDIHLIFPNPVLCKQE